MPTNNELDKQNLRNLRQVYLTVINNTPGNRASLDDRINSADKLVKFATAGKTPEENQLRKEILDNEVRFIVSNVDETLKSATAKYEFLAGATNEEDRQTRQTFLSQEGTVEAAQKLYAFIETGKK